ncbi:MAG: hypothetical protein HRT67_07175 [Flavobacteriaceae bacterium]|nr:hypothetical protein [Flavobacteriaceae bacterium]
MLSLKQKFCTAVTVFCLLSYSTAQCAMCRAVLESEEGQNAAEGINNGIVYLMTIPYLLVGGVAFLIYKRLKIK